MKIFAFKVLTIPSVSSTGVTKMNSSLAQVQELFLSLPTISITWNRCLLSGGSLKAGSRSYLADESTDLILGLRSRVGLLSREVPVPHILTCYFCTLLPAWQYQTSDRVGVLSACPLIQMFLSIYVFKPSYLL